MPTTEKSYRLSVWFFLSVLLICNSIHIHLVAGEGTVSQCLWQSRQFICRQKSPLRVTVLQWQQLNTSSAKSWLESVLFLPCHVLTLILFTSKIFDSPFDICWIVQIIQKVQLDLFDWGSLWLPLAYYALHVHILGLIIWIMFWVFPLLFFFHAVDWLKSVLMRHSQSADAM